MRRLVQTIVEVITKNQDAPIAEQISSHEQQLTMPPGIPI